MPKNNLVYPLLLGEIFFEVGIDWRLGFRFPSFVPGELPGSFFADALLEDGPDWLVACLFVLVFFIICPWDRLGLTIFLLCLDLFGLLIDFLACLPAFDPLLFRFDLFPGLAIIIQMFLRISYLDSWGFLDMRGICKRKKIREKRKEKRFSEKKREKSKF